MRKHLFALTGAVALGLATAVSGSLPAGAIQLAPGVVSAADTNVIQVQREGREGGRDAGASSGGERRGGSDGVRGSGRGGDAANTRQRSVQGQRPQVQRQNVQRQNVQQESVQRESVQRQDVRRDRQRTVSPRTVERNSRVTVQRSGDHRPVRRGWSRDRRHIFYGAYLIGVPFGYTTYATHPCYSWLIGPQGPGYYWDYDRCPV
jgi:hypothetical protein